jgi:UDP-N-acetylmuramate dehydrogenase
MSKIILSSIPLDDLRIQFGERLQENVMLANYTVAQVGGRADGLLIAHTAVELENTVQTLWKMQVPFYVLGAGSNILVSDEGYRGMLVVNRARTVKIDMHGDPPTVWAESGANLGGIARQAVLRGLGGLEWAASIPGTLGGAVYGNAGAHGADMTTNLLVAEILHQDNGRCTWNCEQMQYGYRTSILKQQPRKAVILTARLKLQLAAAASVQAKMDEFVENRRRTQPQGASLGSIFKNPPGDYAGRLIESVGLKGKSIGKVQISQVHANFFINTGGGTASDYNRLIKLAQKTVEQKTGIHLDLEVELLGKWEGKE